MLDIILKLTVFPTLDIAAIGLVFSPYGEYSTSSSGIHPVLSPNLTVSPFSGSYFVTYPLNISSVDIAFSMSTYLNLL